jgi:hypothetical protein
MLRVARLLSCGGNEGLKASSKLAPALGCHSAVSIAVEDSDTGTDCRPRTITRFR